MRIRNKLIKLLGGMTTPEYYAAVREAAWDEQTKTVFRVNHDIRTLKASMIVNDHINIPMDVIRRELAQKIADGMFEDHAVTYETSNERFASDGPYRDVTAMVKVVYPES